MQFSNRGQSVIENMQKKYDAGDVPQFGRLRDSEGAPLYEVVKRYISESILQGELTAGEVATLLEGHDEVSRANFVVVSVGVNDTLDLHSDTTWTEELTSLLLSVCGQAQVVLLGVPPMETLPALPQRSKRSAAPRFDRRSFTLQKVAICSSGR